MFKYDELIVPYIEDEYKVEGDKLKTKCPGCGFLDRDNFALEISLETGFFICKNDCRL